VLAIFGHRNRFSFDVRKWLSKLRPHRYIGYMESANRSLYQALTARDRRFDGIFFVGVTSTGIYCRPICPARTPKEANCRFFNSAQEAEQDHFRPCLRCRPELAPGNAPIDDSQRIAHLIVARLEDGTIGTDAGLEAIAGQFALSSRQIRRIIQKELGVPPIQLLLTRRLLLAKQLLTETALPVTEIAFASGFASLRRFNDAFKSRYRLSPSRLRHAADARRDDVGDTASIQLAYRPPYDWEGVLHFLAGRELKGVEWVTATAYARTVHLGNAKGWIRVTQPKQNNTLTLQFSRSLTPVLPTLLTRIRELFDLNARPDMISAHLGADDRLAPFVQQNPGMRVPGAFNGFELGLRAIIGQQVTVKAATTIGCRLAEQFGESIVTAHPQLNRLTPSAQRLAKADIGDIARLGIVRVRSQSIICLAQAQVSGDLALDGGVHYKPEEAIRRLVELPGIGQWTAHYIAMRALRWPDAFPKEDIVVRNRLGGVSAKQAESMSQSWRPWRSYAVMHLWRSAGSVSLAPKLEEPVTRRATPARYHAGRTPPAIAAAAPDRLRSHGPKNSGLS
jgi:AraC family transcriptional regulator, regulatory protein of adaptative response / DNA-3-methyladenine glycosylase II